MSTTPRVVFGLPLYNRAQYLPEALESLLAQSDADFRVVMVDDASPDCTEQIARRYASIDPRLTYYRNDARIGMIQNWRRAFQLARELYPAAEYFAWASDHDLWHPRWLASLLGELEGEPVAVLAYPLSVRIDEEGDIVRGPWAFETRGVSNRLNRLTLTCLGMSAGNMVYGLFRADSLEQAGQLRAVLVPDRLLLAELSLYGEFRQFGEILWFRRFSELFSFSRQRRSFFPEGVPLYTWLPCAIQHSGALVWNLAIQGAGLPAVSRLAGLGLGVAYLPISLTVEVRNRGLILYRLVRKHCLKAAKVVWRLLYRRLFRPARNRSANAAKICWQKIEREVVPQIMRIYPAPSRIGRHVVDSPPVRRIVRRVNLVAR